MHKTAIVAAALLLGLSQAALAANQEGAFSLSPVVGGYTFENSQHKDTSVVIGGRAGYNFTERFGVEGLIDYTHAKGNSGTDSLDFYRYGGELLYHMLPKHDLVPYLAVGVGGVTASQGGGNRLAFDYGAGLKYFMTENLALRADVRGINYKYDKYYTNLEYTVGLYIPFTAPKPAPLPVKAPEPVVETAAPKAVPVVVAPPPPTSELKAEPALLEKGKTTTLHWSSTNTSGCEILPGIGPVVASGSMSVTPNADTNYTLTCAGEGGKTTSTAAVQVTEPPLKEAAAAKASAVAAGARLSLKVNFDTGKSIIKKQYYDELKTVGDGMQKDTNLRAVIEGYTDNVGSAKSNLALSQRRANAVRDYLVKHFKIDRKRLAAKGYGEERPVADNATAEGRAQNRRIEAVFEDASSSKSAADKQQARPVKKAVKKSVSKKKSVKK